MNYLILLICLLIFDNISYSKPFLVSVDVPKMYGTFGKWKVMEILGDDNKKICYIFSEPVDKIGNHVDSRTPYLMISFFAKRKKEISISTGYKYKKNSSVSVTIDESQFRFIAEQDSVAWPEQNISDENIIEKMSNSNKIAVFAESAYGTYTIDTYSLEGFKFAYIKMIENCKEYNI